MRNCFNIVRANRSAVLLSGLLFLGILIALIVYWEKPEKAPVEKPRSQSETLSQKKNPFRELEKAAVQLKNEVSPKSQEIDQFLSISMYSSEALAWAFSKTKNTQLLERGLLKDPENFLLRFMAAASSNLTGKTGEFLKKESLEWLELHNPALLAVINMGDGKAIDHNALVLINTGDFTVRPENILKKQGADFYTNIRDIPVAEANIKSTIPTEFSVGSMLMAGILAPDMLTRLVTTLARTDTNSVDEKFGALAMARGYFGRMDPSEILAVMDQPADALLESINTELDDMQALSTFRTKMKSENKPYLLAKYQELCDVVGEIEALRQLRASIDP